MKALTLALTSSTRQELTRLTRTSPLPYIRERASALLKVASGLSCYHVALEGLLHCRKPDTVRGWVHRFKQEGIKGLYIRAGRGRRRTFSPSATR